MASRLIVALDELSMEKALHLAQILRDEVWGFKVNDLLLECGIDIIKKLKRFGHVFADPKLHDIPNTVRNGVSRLDAAGADLITIHASGGVNMIKEAVAAAKNSKILTVLTMTSLTDEDTNAVYAKPVNQAFLTLAEVARTGHTHGFICSGPELGLLKDFVEPGTTVVTPGVRPSWYGTPDDQNRINTPREAIANGATLIVVGRPITKDPDPAEAAKRINAEL